MGGKQIEPVGSVTARSAWVHELPKIELHLHLEGAIRPDTVRHLSVERLGWQGELARGWQHTYYTYTDFAGFMEQLTPRFPGNPEEYARIAAECFEDLAALNVIYAEVSFDVPVRQIGDEARFWPIMEALESERRRAEARWPITINFIAGLMRTLPVEVAMHRVDLVIAARDSGVAIVAIDLHGDETKGHTVLFAPAFRRAEAAGLGLRAHAGEAEGGASMWAVIDVLGAKRMAHGVRALEDRTLVERLTKGDITLELCPTSNVRTAIFPSLAEHPFRRLYELGIPVTVNSDDPLPFFTDIERECRLLVDEFDFTREDLKNIMLNAARGAFLPAPERQRLIDQIEVAYRQQRLPVGEALL